MKNQNLEDVEKDIRYKYHRTQLNCELYNIYIQNCVKNL